MLKTLGKYISTATFIFIFFTKSVVAAPQNTRVNFDVSKVVEKPKLSKEEQNLNKELLWVNGTILLIGFANWDWGTKSFSKTDEGYFQENTKSGGADKLGHFYTGYLIDDLLTKSLINKGWEKHRASVYAGTATFLSTLLIELGDGTSTEYGFSYEDQWFNTIGVLASYILINNPWLDEKIDFRIEYWPSVSSLTRDGNIVDDYENMRFFAAVKLGGFDVFERSWLKFVELQTSYKTRGYDRNLPTKSRDISFGVGLNVGELTDSFTGNKTNKYVRGSFDYYQLPYTYVHEDNDLN